MNKPVLYFVLTLAAISWQMLCKPLHSFHWRTKPTTIRLQTHITLQHSSLHRSRHISQRTHRFASCYSSIQHRTCQQCWHSSVSLAQTCSKSPRSWSLVQNSRYHLITCEAGPCLAPVEKRAPTRRVRGHLHLRWCRLFVISARQRQVQHLPRTT